MFYAGMEKHKYMTVKGNLIFKRMNVLSNMTTLRDGKYRILRPLGHGSFGVTYLATAKFVVKGTLGEMETEVKVAVKEFFMGDP